MLIGTTPFKGRNQTDTFRRIVSQDLKFPSTPTLSKHARDLIKKLLHRDPKRRLGARHGAPEIKKHPFFKGVNWALIRNETPPIAPSLSHELDISHFRRFDTRDDILNDIDDIEEYHSKSEDIFSGFDYSGAKGRDAYGKDVAKEPEKGSF
jgi:protein-serine/threonine kinase